MKKLLFFTLLILLVGCQNKRSIFEQYEISYSRSGGYAPIYENLLIKENTAYFFYEGRGSKYEQKVKISPSEKNQLLSALEKNNISGIRADNKKVYDNITTTVKLKRADTSIFKDDGSFIIPEHQARWANITSAFESFIKSKNLRRP